MKYNCVYRDELKFFNYLLLKIIFHCLLFGFAHSPWTMTSTLWRIFFWKVLCWWNRHTQRNEGKLTIPIFQCWGSEHWTLWLPSACRRSNSIICTSARSYRKSITNWTKTGLNTLKRKKLIKGKGIINYECSRNANKQLLKWEFQKLLSAIRE